MLYDNQEIKSLFGNFLTEQTSKLESRPLLHIALASQDLASQKYTALKAKVGAQMGFDVIINNITDLQMDRSKNRPLEQGVDFKTGFILQLPAPLQFEKEISKIDFWKGISDVDFLSPLQEINWQQGFLPPTIQAIDLVLKSVLIQNWQNKDFVRFLETKIDLSGLLVAVVGQGKLVGKFMLRYLSERGATVISINKNTPRPSSLVNMAEIVVSAAGVPNLVDSRWLKDGAILIDAATSESNGSLAGDVNIEELQKSGKINQITLVKSPGGIGPITVLALFYNLLRLPTF